MKMCAVWILIAVASAIVEAATIAVVAIWFVLGAGAAMLAVLAGMHLGGQIATFLLVSGLGLALFRKIWKVTKVPISYTNFDRYIGNSYVVIDQIDDIAGTGSVKINGQCWSARTVSGDAIIPSGSRVVAERFEGCKVIVSLQPDSFGSH